MKFLVSLWYYIYWSIIVANITWTLPYLYQDYWAGRGKKVKVGEKVKEKVGEKKISR